MNNKDLYDLVKQKSSIVKTVSSFIDVQKKGNSIVAVCPFHNDMHPSMSVNATLNILSASYVALAVILLDLFKIYWVESLYIFGRSDKKNS